jgi:hypothetical protein
MTCERVGVTLLANAWQLVSGERVGITSLANVWQLRHWRTRGNYVSGERVGVTSMGNVLVLRCRFERRSLYLSSPHTFCKLISECLYTLLFQMFAYLWANFLREVIFLGLLCLPFYTSPHTQLFCLYALLRNSVNLPLMFDCSDVNSKHLDTVFPRHPRPRPSGRGTGRGPVGQPTLLAFPPNPCVANKGSRYNNAVLYWILAESRVF